MRKLGVTFLFALMGAWTLQAKPYAKVTKTWVSGDCKIFEVTVWEDHDDNDPRNDTKIGSSLVRGPGCSEGVAPWGDDFPEEPVDWIQIIDPYPGQPVDISGFTDEVVWIYPNPLLTDEEITVDPLGKEYSVGLMYGADPQSNPPTRLFESLIPVAGKYTLDLTGLPSGSYILILIGEGIKAEVYVVIS